MIVAAQESFQSLYPHRSRHANHVFFVLPFVVIVLLLFLVIVDTENFFL